MNTVSCPVRVGVGTRIVRAFVALVCLSMALELLSMPLVSVALFAVSAVVATSIFTTSCFGIFARFIGGGKC